MLVVVVVAAAAVAVVTTVVGVVMVAAAAAEALVMAVRVPVGVHGCGDRGMLLPPARGAACGDCGDGVRAVTRSSAASMTAAAAGDMSGMDGVRWTACANRQTLTTGGHG